MRTTKDDVIKAKAFKDHSLVIDDSYNSTVMGSWTMRYSSRFTSSSVSDDFLLNYRLNNNKPDFTNSIANFNSSNAVALMRTTHLEDETAGIELPRPKAPKGSLMTSLSNRHSVRTYSKQKMGKTTISSLMFHSLGVQGDSVSGRIYPRPYASGGGLYPIYLYIYANRLGGFEKGIYKYQPFTNTLLPISFNTIDLNQLANVEGIDTENLSFVGFWVYDRRKNYFKYGDLGTALAFTEAGEAMQTMALVGQLLGIGFCELGGYSKMNVERFIEIDGLDVHAIGSFIAGLTE